MLRWFLHRLVQLGHRTLPRGRSRMWSERFQSLRKKFPLSRKLWKHVMKVVRRWLTQFPPLPQHNRIQLDKLKCWGIWTLLWTGLVNLRHSWKRNKPRCLPVLLAPRSLQVFPCRHRSQKAIAAAQTQLLQDHQVMQSRIQHQDPARRMGQIMWMERVGKLLNFPMVLGSCHMMPFVCV